MSLIDKIERRAPWIAAPHVVLALVAGQTFFYLTGMLGMVDVSRLGLAMALVQAGEWWRVFTFVFEPPTTHWALVAFGLYCFFMLGGALEQEWGRARLNLYLLTGYLLTVLAAALTPSAWVDNYFAAGALFLAFAYLNPNYVFYLFMLVPVQVKYLALVAWIYFGYLFFTQGLPTKLMVLAATGNFLLFFAPSLWRDIKTGQRQMGNQAKRRGELREAAAAGPRHQCAVCAKNSDTHPEEDFRYSADDRCYCSEHRPKKPSATAGSATS
jgi:hypothetical protein